MSLFLYTFADENKSVFIMKVKVTKEQIQKVLDDPNASESAKIKVNDPWWVITLKVIAYIIGLILAGATTAGCTHAMGII